MRVRILLLFAALCCICPAVFSQEESGEKPDFAFSDDLPRADFVSTGNIPNHDSVFVINSFTFNIKGYTRPFALIYKGNLIKGEEIAGFSNLEKYIKDKTQILYNERVLESVSIDYTIGQAQEDGKYPVDLVINIKDTWNIVAIPRPKYSSNTGFDITIKARDYNFLGTMSALRVDLGYIYDNEGRNFFLFMLDSNIPFRAFDLNWKFKFVNFFDYRPDLEQPFYFRNTTGLSVELPVKFTTVTVGFDESFILNEENSDIYKPLYGNFQDGLYMSSNPYVSWKIPTGVDIGIWGELVYTPEISASFNHELPQWPLAEIRKGPSLSFSHSLGFDRVDWIGNFLRGFDVYISNSLSYNFYRLRNDTQPWRINYRISGLGHFIITDFFGISTRLQYRQWIFSDYGNTEAGDNLRGILDRDVCADYMLSLNLDFPVRVLRFSPSIWLNNEKLRLFNFDLHVSPIIDAAVYHDPEDKAEFSSKNILVTGGMEVIIFPEFFRSLYLRISMGWNLSNFTGFGNSEIFIGTDLHY